MDKKSKLLFISNGIPSFTKVDIDILKNEYEIILFSKLWIDKFSYLLAWTTTPWTLPSNTRYRQCQ